jgi:FkbM family methyltransferase
MSITYLIKKINVFFFKSSFDEKKIILKDVFFTFDSENITRVIKLIKKTQNKINDKSTIIDVGAFNGETAKLLSKAFPATKIIAFEANLEVYKQAVKNCSRQGNIEFLNYAISNKNETIDFYVTNNSVSSSLNKINNSGTKDYEHELDIKQKVSVNAKRLDEYTDIEAILLLKIDTQGNELKVIEGAKEMLKKTAFVLVEMSNHNIYIDGCKYFEVDEMMRNNNFTLVDIIVTYRKDGFLINEYDAIYMNNKYVGR